MNAKEFMQLDLRYRYARLQDGGKKLATFHEPNYVTHLYQLDLFFAEVRLDPMKYSIISIEPFDENHPRYEQYMQKIPVTVPTH